MNKISHLYTVATAGTTFSVLPEHFVVALPHERSTSWHTIYGKSAWPFERLKLRALYRQFKTEVASGQWARQVGKQVGGEAGVRMGNVMEGVVRAVM